jgi:hypothetical protein
MYVPVENNGAPVLIADEVNISFAARWSIDKKKIQNKNSHVLDFNMRLEARGKTNLNFFIMILFFS